MDKEKFVKKILTKYENHEAEFIKYFKYIFEFEVDTQDENSLIIGVGGDADVVYDLEIEPVMQVKDLLSDINYIIFNGKMILLD